MSDKFVFLCQFCINFRKVTLATGVSFNFNLTGRGRGVGKWSADFSCLQFRGNGFVEGAFGSFLFIHTCCICNIFCFIYAY